MSGTSMDGVDGVMVDFSGEKPLVLQHSSAAFEAGLKAELLALNSSGPDELHRSALAANSLVRLYASVVNELLNDSLATRSQVKAIGAHGQTVRHRPQCFDSCGYTIQLNSPALLAELTGIDVVADFRSRDVAAGGQGAPLVPAFHREMFGKADQSLVVLNIGGISNISVLPATAMAPNYTSVSGFDCGPGNALMDHWCQQHLGQAFDSGGLWAASGQVIPDLLTHLADEPFLALAPPKSTGRDLFNPAWLAVKLVGYAAQRAQDIQATLTEFTALTCATAIDHHAPDSETLIVCGGGALNLDLLSRLQRHLPSVRVESSMAHGLPPLQVEAAAFAWLARKAMHRETGNLKQVTGARGERILGAIYPA
jgi:anhydro-N-acetylmuramic acid kinase